jgi:hypothetical protein
MTRYFYYLLANVYVAVGLGSVATSLNSIINNPASILTILGSSLPSFSIYFTNLVIIKTFTGIPMEMLRVFPLFDIAIVSACINKKTVTRRQMRTGAFAGPAMLYGWIYPNLLMILMIMLTYSCVSTIVFSLKKLKSTYLIFNCIVDRPACGPVLPVVLHHELFLVQVSAAVCIRQRIAIWWLHVVCCVQPVNGGVALWCASTAVLPFDKRNVFHWSFLPPFPIAVPNHRILVPMQQGV